MVRRSRHGFTLLEVLIAMIVGVIMLTLTMQVVRTVMKSSMATDSRSELDRTGRLVGSALQRDLQEAGVSVSSTVNFGSIYVGGDTLVILRVPYRHFAAGDTAAYVYPIVMPATQPAAGSGTCGTYCVDISLANSNPVGGAALPVQTTAGGAALLIANGQPRLLLPTAVNTTGAASKITFANIATFAGHLTGLSNPAIQLAASGNTLQQVVATMYYRSGTSLMRATSFDASGAPQGQILADSVTAWRVRLLFSDGDSAATANPNDADNTNDWNDLSCVRVTATIKADRPDARNGQLPTPKTYQWTVSPRNLTYERNRQN